MLSGRNATLVIKSNAGKAEININVEVEDVRHPLNNQHLLRHGPRNGPCNGPSREQRRLRRAAAALSAQEAKKCRAC